MKLKPKAANKPLPYFILRELDKPGSSATVSNFQGVSEEIKRKITWDNVTRLYDLGL